MWNSLGIPQALYTLLLRFFAEEPVCRSGTGTIATVTRAVELVNPLNFEDTKIAAVRFLADAERAAGCGPRAEEREREDGEEMLHGRNN